ncbi:PREDICTED: GFP-like non-fluorescent chromoprotein [Branchiostoma belcheri]|uniref:GFP-like non-fluorescent chromoprotein n=1 Tax=Branchiostoma belcheri TaxID=7741 RepID=A0A6P4ZFC6_BRABE|nr:PREDICTED: GFP-like non-fluorescent chromoprotein [Branchiostoma belcheri]
MPKKNLKHAPALPTNHDLHIFGSVNGLEFDMVGGGSGNPKAGTLETSVKSTRGALPFSPLLVAPNLGYGFYQYLPFPDGPSPFQTAITDGGYEVNRVFKFEDGGVLSAHFRYTYEGGKIKGEFQLVGSGFPASGPVMTSGLTSLDRSVAKLMCSDNRTLTGLNNWSFCTSDGQRHQAVVQTNYTFAKPFPAGTAEKMPVFMGHQIEVNASKTEIALTEKAKAFCNTV